MLLEFWFLPFYLMAIFAQHNDIAMISPTLKRPLAIWIFLFLSLNLPVTLIKSNYYHLNAQESKPESSSWSEDPLGRQTPRGTASGFINAVADKNYQKAEAYLNFEAVENPEDHIAIVKTLESLLNQNGYLYPYSSISSDNTGKANDGLPPSIDRVGMLSINGEEMDLTVEKIEGNERAPIWLFSKNTVKLLQEIDIRSTNTSGTIEALLPSFLKRWSYGGAVIGHWIAMLLIGILSYLIAWAVVFITDKIIKVFWKSANEEPVSNILKVIAFPVQLFLAVWLLVYASNQLGISIVVRQKFSWLPVICSIIALSLILWRVTQFLTDFSQKKMNLRGNVSGVSVILFLNRAAKIAIVVFGIIAILDAVGVDVTTGLAALGIGGIALALGAQKTVENFDEFLRARAEESGAHRFTGTFLKINRQSKGNLVTVVFKDKKTLKEVSLGTKLIIGADGARSDVARAEMPGGRSIPYVIAYHEIIQAPKNDHYDPERCDVIYDGNISPDFYGWIFPHGKSASVGMGTGKNGFDLKAATAKIRENSGLDKCMTIRKEGAPIPLKPLDKWDNGKDLVLTGDAAGVVAPSSGEGIYYAMIGGQEAAFATHKCLLSKNPKDLQLARKRFMSEHKTVFRVLEAMQNAYYKSDNRRERFVSLCKDEDVQKITFESYMHKKLVARKPLAHLKIMVKNLLHLFLQASQKDLLPN